MLELRTVEWGFVPAPWQYRFQTGPKRFGVHLEVELTLTDLRDGSVLVHHTCIGDDPRLAVAQRATSVRAARDITDGLPTFGELVADDATLLRAEVLRASVRCDDVFRGRVLHLADESGD